ncbi:hypothetical protein [Cellulomonas sp. KRMCY2]|uniref:hypothetical protein n=1 Tax=Cellulomonas sp. KRMCY2 TaxID=1304865 RepID=UPI00045EA7DC|nr:hypothetical protein [Cellulomonas sp. KRMCY2]
MHREVGQYTGMVGTTRSAVVAPLVGVAGEGTAVPMGLAMIISIALAVLAFVSLTRPRPVAPSVAART